MIKRSLNAVDDAVSTIALVGVILLTGLNVLFRYIFNTPIAWSMEVALGLFVWFVFIGISSTMKREGHVGVDFFVKKLPTPLRIFSEFIRAAAIYYVLIYVFIYLGSNLTLTATGKLTPILGISYQWINIAIPIGGAITAIHFTRKLLIFLRTEFREEGGGQ
ncbi:tripartite ATP-independent periplasmic transporter DctQ [Lentibacillus kapialis]|uniref:Tripartite ATP-independent periplasmic transporter DctQ n=1 Tax=Lentibacillus kapialis TaxID=340214 RepID=A0A917Q0H4_9BACI|nr:TRAP transporter small permease [Lentibacillus kapialis]GGK02494.1 tripartite ATP-independent periplasmic transporter DctQ [Lentibacillus kapialis]